MNYIYLIGNGFDLAHNLKTSYNQFLNDLIYQNLINSINSIESNPKQLHFELTNPRKTLKSSEIDLNNPTKNLNIIYSKNNSTIGSISPKDSNKAFINLITHNQLLFRTLSEAQLNNWTDIENVYFEILTSIAQNKKSSREIKLNEITELNENLSFISSELKTYLSKINNPLWIQKLNDFFKEIISLSPNRQHLFLNFNYTNTFKDLYFNYLKTTGKSIINIHNSIDDNEIIFGFEDGLSSYYSEIENLNINEFLKNFKSFKYLQSGKYQQTIDFIRSGNYKVIVLGHSCGISDRTLLNHIFENDNCNQIQILYHKKDELDDDFLEKTQNISRNFKNKTKFLDRVLNKEGSEIFPQFIQTNN